MKLRPLTEGAPGKSVWPAIDPYPTNHGLMLDFIGSKTCGRPFYKLLNDRYADGAQIPGWSYSGSTSNGMPRCAETRAGRLVPFAAGVPRITDKGLLVEEARTNYVWNNVMAGGVAGSPGGAPTYWVTSGSHPASVGLTQTIASGVENGLTYLEVTLSGTPTLTGGTGHYFTGTTENILASPGQTWTASAYARLVGAPTGVSSLALNIVERDLGGASTGSSTTAMALGPAMARFVHTRTMAGAATVRVQAGASVNFTAGVPLNVTYRIYAPQMEQGSFVTSPILTTTGVATRAADSVYISGLAAILGKFRTNLIPYSTPTAGHWFATAGGGGVVPTVTYNYEVGPNGAPAARVQLSLGGAISSNDLSSFVTTSVAFTAGVTSTATVWMKSNTAESYQVVLAAPNSSAVTVTVTPEWQRFGHTTTPPSSGIFGLAVRLRGASGSSDSADILVADAQWEVGGAATDFIQTAGAQRSVGKTLTLVAYADLPAADGVNRDIAAISNADGKEAVRLRRGTGNDTLVTVVAGGVSTNVSAQNGFAGARVIKFAVRLRPGSVRLAVDGVLRAETTVTSPSAMDRLSIGGGGGVNGYIQLVGVYGDVDDAMLQALTA